MERGKKLWGFIFLITVLTLVSLVSLSAAQETPPGKTLIPFTKELLDQFSGAKIALDTAWTLIAAFLVMFMGLGFAMLESGFCRAKNAVNILSKNFIVFALTSLSFLMLGWGLMFGDGNALIGTKGLWLLAGADNSPATGEAYKGVYSAIS